MSCFTSSKYNLSLKTNLMSYLIVYKLKFCKQLYGKYSASNWKLKFFKQPYGKYPASKVYTEINCL